MFFLLVSCLVVCRENFYDSWANHPDKRKCYCGVEIDKSAPPPMEINLRWKPGVDAKAERVTPDLPKFPRWDLPEPTPSDDSEEWGSDE